MTNNCLNLIHKIASMNKEALNPLRKMINSNIFRYLKPKVNNSDLETIVTAINKQRFPGINNAVNGRIEAIKELLKTTPGKQDKIKGVSDLLNAVKFHDYTKDLRELGAAGDRLKFHL